MKIGFFDNLANNAYRLTKIFRHMGYKADLLMDGSDTFPMSQPVWEDCDFGMAADLVENGVDREYWERKNVELGWKRPSWVKETNCRSQKTMLLELLSRPMKNKESLKNILKSRSLFPWSVQPIVEAMRQYNLIVAFGLGPVYASFADVPFVHYPYGGDLTLLPFQNDTIGALQRDALVKARSVIIGDPGYLDYLERLGIVSKAIFMPLMVDTDVYKPMATGECLALLDERLQEKIKNRVTFFAPSRIDFQWKGTDKALLAFYKLVEGRKDVLMILSAWGNDYRKAREMIEALNLGEYTYFLPNVLSKKRLILFHSIADVVVDQFNLGAYGTCTMEALACGKPVIVDIDKARYGPYLKKLPPVLYAKSEEEILEAMLEIAINKDNIREKMGRAAREWVTEIHGVESNFDKLRRVCEESL